MTDRDEGARAFLRRIGWGEAAVSPLAGDASNRRYLRVAGVRPAVLMDAPPEKGEDVRPFVAITELLRARGLSAPEILHADAQAGYLLLEDLGDALFARVAGTVPEDVLYAAAVDALHHLHRQPAPGDLPPYDMETCLREAALLTEWYLPGAGREADAGTYATLVREAIAPHLRHDAVVLRDYHAENLIWLPERAGVAAVGLLDYQDALAGHPAYDLVSLLEDARRDTAPALREAMYARFLATSGLPEEAFAAAYAAFGAQRNLKILGIFARLWLRDGKPAYLDLMPRVWAHLQRDLQHPDLAALRDWVAANVPPPDATVRATIRGAR